MGENERHRAGKGILLRLGLLSLVFLVLAGSMVIWHRYRAATLEEPRFPLFSTIRPDLPKVAKATNIKFPSTARLIESKYFQNVNGELYLFAKVEFPSKEVNFFIKMLPSLREVDTQTIPSEFELPSEGDMHSWWNPGEAKNFIVFDIESNQSHPDTHCLLLLLLRKDNVLKTTAYLYQRKG